MAEPTSARAERTALVLGGGGMSGGAYGIGALRALDLLAGEGTINAFDIYVGTSSGALLAAFAAAGVSAEEMMRTVISDHRGVFHSFETAALLKPNLAGIAGSAMRMPLRVAELGWRLTRARDRGFLIDTLLGVVAALPTGLYSTSGIEAFTRDALAPPRSDDFRALERELYITATDLDRCERVVFGEPGSDDVPISRAVGASTALPALYAPVRIGG